MNKEPSQHRIQRVTRRQFLRHTTRISSGAAAAGLGLLAPRAYPVRAQGRGPSSVDNVTIWVAVGSIEFLWAVMKGRKIDQAHGINAQITFLDANAVNQGLILGQVQVGSSQPIPAAIANNAGRNVTIFAPAIWNNTAGITYANSPGSSLKDFVGKRIALLPALSGLYTSTQVIAAELGLNFEKDFKIVTGPPPAVLAFLQRGDVDAVVQIEPIISSLLMSGKYKMFFDANAVWKQLTGDDMLFGALAANQTWLDANRDIAKRITAAIVETGRLIRSDLSVFDEFALTLQLKTPEQIEFAKRRLPAFYPTEWGASSVANGQRVLERAAALGIVKKPSRDIFVAL